MYKGRNFKARVIKDFKRSGMHNVAFKGEEVFIHFLEENQILVYQPYNKRLSHGIVDGIITLEEAKEYFTCTSETSMDIYEAWSKMMSDRYW